MTTKRILLGVCGGIAAYKAAELVRLFRKQGAEVRVVMTASAQQFVNQLTFQALSGHAVHTSLLDAEQENAMGHINLARWADLLVVAPATANAIGKFSHGLADDLLSTLYLAALCPVYVVPAMNQAMWHKPVVQENIARLKQQGVKILGPAQGDQACGETGFGRMLEPTEICLQLCGTDNKPDLYLQGLKVLMTAGPTREPLDPVRYITNRSSGKMGYALAQAAANAGAQVTLVSGPVSLPTPEGIKRVNVESAAQMYQAVMENISECALYIGAAAVADYTPATVQTEKIKKHADDSVLVLQKTQDILAAVAAAKPRPFTVGFAAETQDLETYALDKLSRKNADMIAANWVGQAEGGFDSERNALHVYWQGGQQHLPMTEKTQLAEQLLKLIAKRLHEKNTA
ncbi:bifunctional phosphopantothenoylcysteine decarboxylase/phosphopantothenate--cysteine ligase CoaBC [Methylosoma difficile]